MQHRVEVETAAIFSGHKTRLIAQKQLPPRKRKLRLLAFLAIAVAALCTGRRAVHQVRGIPAEVGPSVKALFGTVERSIRVTGSTAARRGVMLRAPYLRGSRNRGGPRDFQLELTDLVKSGSRVSQGTIVARFDNVNMRNRLDDLGADRADLEDRLRRLVADQLAEREAHDQKIRVALAHIDTARLDLKTAPVRSAIQAQLFALALQEAQASYKALADETKFLKARQAADRRNRELELDRARLEERRAQANIDRLSVRAPISGLAVSQEIYRGGDFAEIRSGDQLRAGQPFLRIVDLHTMIVEATANQADVMQLRIGELVHLGFDAYRNLHLSGEVIAIGSIARTGGWRPSYVAEIPLTISIAGADPKLIPGLSVSADIVLASSRHAVVVPREAVFSRAENDGPCALVQTASGWERRPLILGTVSNTSVAVLSGLTPGESVALEEPTRWTASESGAAPPRT